MVFIRFNGLNFFYISSFYTATMICWIIFYNHVAKNIEYISNFIKNQNQSKSNFQRRKKLIAPIYCKHVALHEGWNPIKSSEHDKHQKKCSKFTEIHDITENMLFSCENGKQFGSVFGISFMFRGWCFNDTIFFSLFAKKTYSQRKIY